MFIFAPSLGLTTEGKRQKKRRLLFSRQLPKIVWCVFASAHLFALFWAEQEYLTKKVLAGFLPPWPWGFGGQEVGPTGGPDPAGANPKEAQDQLGWTFQTTF